MILSYFCDKILKCDEMTDKIPDENMDENTDGTLDIGDYANSILDFKIVYFCSSLFKPKYYLDAG